VGFDGMKSFDEYQEDKVSVIRKISSLLSELETADKLSNNCMNDIKESELEKHEFILKLIGYCLEKDDKSTLDFIENVYIKNNYDIYRDIVDYDYTYGDKEELEEKKQRGAKWFSQKDAICKSKMSEYKAQVTKGEDSFNDFLSSSQSDQELSLEPSSWLDD
jgi:hypothetical protein